MSHITDHAASEQAIKFLAALASDDRARQRDELERLYEFMATPAEMHSMFFAMVQMAGGMWEAANGLSREFWTFEIQTPFGPISVDHAPPAQRWFARWLTACMNGDADTAIALWFTSGMSDDEVKATVDITIPALLAFLRGTVREFLRAGRPLTPEFLASLGGGQ